MKTISAELQAVVDSPAQTQVACVLLEDWSPADLAWTTGDKPVTLGAVNYYHRPMQISGVKEAADGSLQTATITFGNQDRYLTQLAGAYDPRGALLTVRLAYLDDLTDSELLIPGLFLLEWSVTKDVFIAKFGGFQTLLTRPFPRRTFDRPCSLTFVNDGTSWCGYDGVDTVCEYTDDDCKSKSNFNNYGGYLFLVPQDE